MGAPRSGVLGCPFARFERRCGSLHGDATWNRLNRLGDAHGELTIANLRFDSGRIDSLRQHERAAERAERALVAAVAFAFVLAFGLPLSLERQHAVVHVDVEL